MKFDAESLVAEILGEALVAPQDSVPYRMPISAEGLGDPNHRWLWPGYILDGKITNMEARGSGAKTRNVLQIAACGSVGRFPFGIDPQPYTCAPFTTLIFSSEDEKEEIAQTFEECGGDRKRLSIFSSTDLGPICFDDAGAVEIQRMIIGVKARLVVMDPVLEYVAPLIKHQSDNMGITQFLRIQRAMCVTCDCSFVNIRHWAKGMFGKELHELAAGGEAWRNGARGQLVAFGHPANSAKWGQGRTDGESRFLICPARDSMRVQYGGPYELVIRTGHQTFVPPWEVNIQPYADEYPAVRKKYFAPNSEGTVGAGKRGPLPVAQDAAATAILEFLSKNGTSPHRKVRDAIKHYMDTGTFGTDSFYRASKKLIANGQIKDVGGVWGLSQDHATLEEFDPFVSPNDPDWGEEHE